MIKPRKRLVNAKLAALHITRTYGITVAPATIRSWAKRGHITRYDGPRPAAHFDLNEIDEHVRRRVIGGDVAS